MFAYVNTGWHLHQGLHPRRGPCQRPRERSQGDPGQLWSRSVQPWKGFISSPLEIFAVYIRTSESSSLTRAAFPLEYC